MQGTPKGHWEVNDTFLTGSPLLYDGLLLIGREMDDHFLNKASSFVVESYNHFKPIGSFQNGSSIIQSLNVEGKHGVLIEQDSTRLANEDVTKDLNKINVPTKIFHGVHDQLIPYKSAELTQQRIKNSQLHALINSGHGSPIDQADELNKELIKFLHA